jgi:hypothetical protein
MRRTKETNIMDDLSQDDLKESSFKDEIIKILPSFITWYFFRNRYRAGIQAGLLWLGQNLINISVYAADARARVLPLLGGNKAGHDWHYLLGEMNLLEYDQAVGYIFLGISILIFITSLLMPLLIRE